MHPQLNSVIKKSSNDCVQLDETDTQFSSRIVDKFLLDYKNVGKDETKIEESKYKKLENENYLGVASEYEKKLGPELPSSCQMGEQSYLSNIEHSESLNVEIDVATLNRNECSNFFGKKSALSVEGVTENTAEIATNSKRMYPNSTTENLNISCFADIPDCVRNCKNGECFDPVSSVYSKNACFVGECSRKENYSGSNENTLNESNEKLNATFQNIAEMKDDGECDVVGVNLNNSITDILPNTICDSSEIRREDAIVPKNHLVEMTNTLPREESSCDETLNILSSEVETETRTNKDYDITVAVDYGNDVSYDGKNLSDGGIVFSENATGSSDLETSRFIDDSFKNLDKTERTDENFSSVNNVLKFWDKCDEKKANDSTNLSTDLDSFTNKKSGDETTYLNAPRPPVWSSSKRIETTFSIAAVNEDDKKTKISKKKRPSSLKKTKKSKYLYKLKSYTGSVLYFTSSTSVSFIKPVIKLTKLDESLYKNLDSIITSTPNASLPPETNRIDEVEINSNIGDEFKDQVVTEQTSCDDLLLEDQVEAELHSRLENKLIAQVETETKASLGNDSKEQVEAKTNPCLDNNLEEQVEAETNPSLDNDLEKQVEAETNPSHHDDLKIQAEVEPQSITVDELKNEVKKETNSNTDTDLKGQVVQPLETAAERNVNGPNNNYESATTKKINNSGESITPTFGMQTRRKRLKFLPDGTLVTPHQRHQLFPDEFTSTSRAESRIAKKRSLKTSSPDTPKLEKKMKTVSVPVSSTPKQSNRSAISTKKVSRNRPDRYIPKPNGQSKKPQKIFDYDSYYRENFCQTEVKLPPSCKKQMVALSRVTSISSGAQSGGSFTVNPAQLLSCLLSMPITSDQIRTVRFKPRDKQLKPNKQVNITPSKLASNDAIKPINKRHLELLQKTPFNIVPKTEIGIAKSTANTKSQSTT